MFESISARDLWFEARSSLLVSWVRTATSLVGIVLAVAGFITTFGLAATMSGQVSDAFDAVRATEVIVKPVGGVPGRATGELCSQLSLSSARNLSGVVRVGVMQSTNLVAKSARSKLVGDPVRVIGADADAVAAIRPRVTAGRVYDTGADSRGDDVALVPKQLVADLGLSGVGDSIVVGGRSLWVLAIFDDVARRPEAIGAILIPRTTLSKQPAAVSECQVIAETGPGAAEPVAKQIALALDAAQPRNLSVAAPPDPTKFRRSLEGPVQQLSLIMSGAMLLLGLVSIAFAASSSVSARVPEFGLRQSLGATPGAIGAQVVLENILIGLIGGVTGVYLGALAVLGVALGNGWSPILDVPVALVAALGSGLLGGLAGLPSALRASKLNPVAALRA